MIFPRKKLILPCHKNGYLQSASDARKYRDRFKRNPLAKVADMFVPKPLRMSPGYPCCCGGGGELCECDFCTPGGLPDEVPCNLLITIEGLSGDGECCDEVCGDINGEYILSFLQSGSPKSPYCIWSYASELSCCSNAIYIVGHLFSSSGGTVKHFYVYTLKSATVGDDVFCTTTSCGGTVDCVGPSWGYASQNQVPLCSDWYTELSLSPAIGDGCVYVGRSACVTSSSTCKVVGI